ncbi:MAG: xylulokinase [Planktomarina sp.]
MISFIGIDVGTSAVKVLGFGQGCILAQASVPLELLRPAPGWAEQNPDDWYKAVCAAVHDVIAQTGGNSTAVQGIGLSGQMHGAVVLGKDQCPLCPAILWNDNRSAAQCNALARNAPDIGHIAGVPPLPGFTAPKLMWIKSNAPKTYSQIAHVMLPKDYIAFKLTGILGTDHSDAAGSLWYNQTTRDWDADLCAASETDPAWLPPLRYGNECVGVLQSKASQDLGLPSFVRVYAGGGDAATGAVSLGAVKPGRRFMSLGTSAQYLHIDQEYRPNPDMMVHAFAHTLPNLRYRMAAMLNGARPMAWFADVLGCSVPQMLTRAKTAPFDPDLIFLPYLSGERSPHGDPDIRAGFFGINDGTDGADMARAVVESIAFMMCDAVDSFGDANVDDAVIPVIGGGAQSGFLLQTLADVLQVPVGRAAASVGGAAFGALQLARLGAGDVSIDDISTPPVIHKTFAPHKADDLQQKLAKYRALYRALKGVK